MADHDGVRRVRAALDEAGLDCKIFEFDQTTRTAADAAAALACDVAQIVKTLVFRAKDRANDRAVIALVSGAHRADLARLGAIVGERCERADADFVRARTGFPIGGVAPLGHPEPLLTVADEALLGHEQVWVAAGTPHAVFAIAPQALVKLCGAQVAIIASDP